MATFLLANGNAIQKSFLYASCDTHGICRCVNVTHVSDSMCIALQQFNKEKSRDILLTHLPLDKMAAILADDNFKRIFVNENYRIPISFSLKFVPRSPIDNKPALVQVMAWRRRGDKPLPEPMLT